jgi:hypothetical protein
MSAAGAGGGQGELNKQLIDAIEAGNYDTATRILFKPGFTGRFSIINDGYDGRYALNVAVEKGAPLSFITRLVTKYHASPNHFQNGVTPLYLAIKAKNSELIQVLVENGTDLRLSSIDAEVRDRLSPISQAVLQNDQELVSYLVGKGGDINQAWASYDRSNADTYNKLSRNYQKYGEALGYSPLYYAVRAINYDMVNHLIGLGAKVNNYISDRKSQQDLITTVLEEYDNENDTQEMIDYLLDRGAIVKPAHLGDAYYKGYHYLVNIFSKRLFDANNLNAELNIDYVEPALPPGGDVVDYDTFRLTFVEGIPIITIPRGTLLYNVFYISEYKDEDNLLKILSGILPPSARTKLEGNTLNINYCYDKFMGKYFYANPVGGVCLELEGGAVNCLAAFETRREMRFALLMTPGNYHRKVGEHPKNLKYNCDKTPAKDCACSVNAQGKCSYAYDYDTCLSSQFLFENRLDGHIAIAGQDSFADTMRKVEEVFYSDKRIPYVFRKMTELFFSGCGSIDDRTGIGNANNHGNRKYSAFPELVIQIFGTNWYNDMDSKRDTISIPLPPAHTENDRFNRLAGVLARINKTGRLAPGVETPLKLICVSTLKKLYNIEKGVKYKYGFEDHRGTNMEIYYNMLQSYLSGDIRYIVDRRTGFLIREGMNLNVSINGDIRPYVELSLEGSGPADGKTLLERSVITRAHGCGVWEGNCLLPAYNRLVGGRRRPRRRQVGSGKTLKNNGRGSGNRKNTKRVRRGQGTTFINDYISGKNQEKYKLSAAAEEMLDLFTEASAE